MMASMLGGVARLATGSARISRSTQPARLFSSSRALNDTAIVTGSSRGIGKAIALRLAKDGYDVCINDIQANKVGAEEVAHEITLTGRKACVALADVADPDQVDRMIQTSVKEVGPLNTMVANAGIVQVKPVLELTPSDFDTMFRINVQGMHNSFSFAAKQIIAQQTSSSTPSIQSSAGSGTHRRPAGKLIACASAAAFKPSPHYAHYSASKWAVRGLTQAYAMEMAEHNITVNGYAPGIVGTKMWDQIDEDIGRKFGKQLGETVKKGETLKKFARELITLGRVSVPEDVAGLVSFLAGKDSDYVTGQTMLVDGGIAFS